MTMPNLMTIRGLTVDFRAARGDVHALRNVCIDVPESKILGIVGESGSGKSTLVWATTQLLPDNAIVKSGEIRFNGDDVLTFREQQLEHYRGQQVSIVFQDPMTSQIPVITYGGQMADIQYRRHGFSASDKRQAAIDMLRTVGIGDPEMRVNQYPHQFKIGRAHV